jgi:hypothetical protein
VDHQNQARAVSGTHDGEKLEKGRTASADEGPGKFVPSDAAMDEYSASRHRYVRPVLVFLPVMVVFAIVHEHPAIAIPITLAGFVVTAVMIGLNYRVARRADLRLKVEKHAWETNRGTEV